MTRPRVLFVANFATTALGSFSVTVAGTPTSLASENVHQPPAASSGKLDFPGLAARAWAFYSLD